VFWLIASQVFALPPKEIYQKAGPGVVFILASEGSKMGSVGTGSIIRNDGLVITNAHVFIKSDSSRLKSDIAIFLKPRRVTGNHQKDLAHRYKGKILAYDIPLDLALVKITGLDARTRTVQFADSSKVVVGDKVYAIGHPEQGGLWSLTTGVISAYRADFNNVPGKNLFQTDASINRGNSGGPLLDEYGDMVGINSMIARKAADGLTITDVNYSIMSNVAIQWLAGLGYNVVVNRELPSESGGEVAKVPETVEKKSDQPKTGEDIQPYKDEPVKEKDKPKEDVADVPDTLKEIPAQPSGDKPLKEKDKPKKSEGGKILTKKKPYKTSRLLRDIQAMEDMMDEMREKINKYKEKKY
jgi:serine protease Do